MFKIVACNQGHCPTRTVREIMIRSRAFVQMFQGTGTKYFRFWGSQVTTSGLHTAHACLACCRRDSVSCL